MRQPTARQADTGDRVGTLPLNSYETPSVLNPLDLRSMLKHPPRSLDEVTQAAEVKARESREDKHCEQTDQTDNFSSSESDSDEDFDDALGSGTEHDLINQDWEDANN